MTIKDMSSEKLGLETSDPKSGSTNDRQPIMGETDIVLSMSPDDLVCIAAALTIAASSITTDLDTLERDTGGNVGYIYSRVNTALAAHLEDLNRQIVALPQVVKLGDPIDAARFVAGEPHFSATGSWYHDGK